MRAWIKAAAAGVLAAGGIGLAAAALEGAYVTQSGVKITFSADNAHVELPDGVVDDVPIAVEGDTLTMQGAAAGPCMDIAATYTIAESDDGVTLTVVEDACEPRRVDLSAGPLKKAE